jgi:transcriptional regulator GlxA family with amidase domain
MAWIDVALMLIERLLGGAIRARTAEFVLSAPDAGRAPVRSAFLPRQGHGDAAVLRAQQLVHLKDGCDLLLSTMAAAAGLERRTFLRRFMAATGTTPIEYCRAVRIARARELLEERRTFLRRFMAATGTTPIEYCRAVRIARARELLEASSMPLKTIAEELGYTDAASFAKAFRRAYGLPPGAWRRHRGGAVAGSGASGRVGATA